MFPRRPAVALGRTGAAVTRRAVSASARRCHRPAGATPACVATRSLGTCAGTRPADPVGIRWPGGRMSPLARPWGRGWRGERGGRGAPRVRPAGAGAGARDPRPCGALGERCRSGRGGWRKRCVRTVSSGRHTGEHWLDPAHPDCRRAPAGRDLSGARSGLPSITLFSTTRCGPRTFPRPGVCSRSPSGPAGGYRPHGSRSTGSRSASGGSSHAERVVLRRYGGRLAASGTTRLRPDRYSWKAEGEARGHLRTDTLYNARTARMFRPHKVIWIAANRVTVWSARKPGDG